MGNQQPDKYVNHKVVLIENQITHFRAICEFLKDNECRWTIIPSVDDYEIFINLVRIFLDMRYPKVRRKKALNKLESIIGDAKLLLIDHKLIGHTSREHGQLNGINLVQELTNNNFLKFRKKPVIFLSNSVQNKPEIIHDLNQLESIYKKRNIEWVNKGLAGDGELGDKQYYSHHVKNKIEKIVKKKINVCDHDFDIAISYCMDDSKENVKKVHNCLCRMTNEENIFFDQNYSNQPVSKENLKKIYENQSSIIVVFMSENYFESHWCIGEFNAAEKVNEEQAERVIYILMNPDLKRRFDDTYAIVDWNNSTPQRIAELIVERLQLL